MHLWLKELNYVCQIRSIKINNLHTVAIKQRLSSRTFRRRTLDVQVIKFVKSPLVPVPHGSKVNAEPSIWAVQAFPHRREHFRKAQARGPERQEEAFITALSQQFHRGSSCRRCRGTLASARLGPGQLAANAIVLLAGDLLSITNRRCIHIGISAPASHRICSNGKVAGDRRLACARLANQIDWLWLNSSQNNCFHLPCSIAR